MTDAKETHELLTNQDLADLLRGPLSYVYRLRHQGRAPRSIRIGGRVLYRRADVDAWLETHTEE